MTVTLSDVERVASLISGHVIRTPTTASRTLSEITGADVSVKFENLQFTASFKERGALNRLLSLDDAERAVGVVTMSAGNFAQAIAYHATRLQIGAVVVMPTTTPNIKVTRTKDLGAEIVLYGSDVAEAAAHAREIASSSGRVIVHPYDDPHVIAGQGTVALEMLADAPDIDVLVVPVGGGGLLAGMTVAATDRAELIGVQSEVYPSMVAALRGDEPPRGGPTIAEGIAVKEAGALTREIIASNGVDVVTVSEAHIEEAVALYLEIEKVVAEGAGAAALAALLEHPDRFRGRRVGLVLSGGNIDLQLLASVIMRSLVRTGRLVTIRVAVPDIPGALGRVTAVVGEAGGNIIDVLHRRYILQMPSRAAQLDLTIEVPSADAAYEMMRLIGAAGYDAEFVPHGLA